MMNQKMRTKQGHWSILKKSSSVLKVRTYHVSFSYILYIASYSHVILNCYSQLHVQVNYDAQLHATTATLSFHNGDKTEYVSSSLLRYTTGLSTIPPLLGSESVKITYQQNDVTAIYPKAQVCFSRLSLPVVHTNQHSFNAAFCKALEFGGGYGNTQSRLTSFGKTCGNYYD